MDLHERAMRMQINRLLRRNEKLEAELKAARAAYRDLVLTKLETMVTPAQLFEALRDSWQRERKEALR